MRRTADAIDELLDREPDDLADICPMCEEVQCDGDCPLSYVRSVFFV